VVFNPFSKRDPAEASASQQAGDSVVSEFAATVAVLPAPAEAALSLRLVPDHKPEREAAVYAGPDSVPDSVPDSIPDSGIPDVVTDFGVDSLPAPAELSATQAAPTLQHIGRYALKAPLGVGGLGQVHEAWDPLLSRTVAVKTLQFDIDTPTRVSLDGLFLNEARAAGGLSHPHIVTVFDAGLSARGVYIAMERLRGRDLRHALAAGWRPTPLEAALLVRRVADALAYAHAKGVVHCDIKPANIFLTKRDKPKVLDFGIARVAHAGALPGLDGLVMGSPHYLAPEQLNGGEVSARTDIHALGVVFYELLAGRKAFEGDSVEQITNAVLHAHPAPAHDVLPGVPSALSAIAARAMARDPAERYAQADEMANQLRRWCEQQQARGEGARRPTEAEITRPRRRSVAAGSAGKAAGGRWPAGSVWGMAGGKRRVAVTVASITGIVGLALLIFGTRPGPTAPNEPATLAVAPASAATTAAGAASLPPAAADTTGEAPAPDTIGDASADGQTVDGASAQADAAQASSQAAAPAAPSAPKARPVRRARPAVAAAVAPAPAAVVAEGTLQLAISPWGEVEVDGQVVGTTPPLARLNLPAGRHTVTVRNSDFAPHSVTVEIVADEAVTVRHRFGP
jgi:serine/threonine-protein kinase